MEKETGLKPCPICGCSNIYEIDREDHWIGRFPQLFCNGCKMTFEVENDSPHIKDDITYKYLRHKLLATWNKRK
jgi:transposase-like protein